MLHTAFTSPLHTKPQWKDTPTRPSLEERGDAFGEFDPIGTGIIADRVEGRLRARNRLLLLSSHFKANALPLGRFK